MKKLFVIFLLLYSFLIAKSISKKEDPPKAKFECNDKSCVGSSLEFQDNSENADIIFWDFGDGWTSELIKNPFHIYENKGFYTVQLIAKTEEGLSDTIEKTIEIKEAPVIEIIFDGDTTIMKGKELSVSLSQNYNFISWEHWNGILYGQSVKLKEAGTYTVNIEDENLCTDIKKFSIVVLEEDQIDVKTIITPNDDGFNDKFYIENIEVFSESKVFIYNRWGDEVYVSDGEKYSNEENAWDGTKDGEELPEGSYYYLIKCGDLVLKGAVNILR